MMSIVFIILCMLKFSDSYKTSMSRLSMLKERSSSSIFVPIKKIDKQPILKIKDKKTGAKITLVGVSHGSKGSADLVKQVINEIDPSVVVLELCEDRYLSISISNNIDIPKENITIWNRYNEYMDKIKLSDNDQNNAIQRTVSDLIKVGIYVKSQGFVGGFFLVIGLFFSSFQRINQTADEFATAMIEAGTKNIPIRLGDAPQNDTMNSMKKILDYDTFNPERIYKDSLNFLFSFFGIFPSLSGNPQINSKIPDVVLKQSEWLVIPKAYLDNLSMVKSLWPLFLLNFISFALDIYPTMQDNNPSQILPIASDNDILNMITTFMQMEVPSDIAQPLSVLVNLLGVLIVIRIARLIGSDRDIIIASKIQEVAKEFPNKEVVVVIGMLHANGVARILLSGVDPLLKLSSSK